MTNLSTVANDPPYTYTWSMNNNTNANLQSLEYECYLDFTSLNSCVSPDLSAGSYILELSGTYGLTNNSQDRDAAFSINGGGDFNDWTWNELCTFTDTCYNFRPIGNTYNPNHVYYYPFNTSGGSETIYGVYDFDNYENNSGGLNVKIYSLSETSSTGNPSIISLPNPSIYDATLEISNVVTGCSDIFSQSDAVRITGNTEFIVEKLSGNNVDTFNNVLCNGEKIRLTNTSVHYSSCPDCFSWVLGGDVVNVDDQGETITFSYDSYSVASLNR